jgi:hypothetical protein
MIPIPADASYLMRICMYDQIKIGLLPGGEEEGTIFCGIFQQAKKFVNFYNIKIIK